MAPSVEEMLKMSRSELDELFGTLEPGPIPRGEAKGTAIIFPGTSISDEVAQMVSLFAWQGKVFDPDGGYLRNQILPFGLRAIVAKVYKDASWLDGKECIVLDYSETSTLAQWIRDEIRMIEPGRYLGKVFWSRNRLIDFVLEFPTG